MLHQIIVEMGAKTLSCDTALPESAVATRKETARSFIERLMVVHKVKKSNESIASTVIESYADTTYYKLQPPLKSIVNPPFE